MRSTWLLILLCLSSCSPGSEGKSEAAKPSAPVEPLPIEPPKPEGKKGPPKDLAFFRAGMNPGHRVQVREEGDLKAFVEAHLMEEIPSLGIDYIAADSKEFSELKRLKGLNSVTLSGTWVGKPVRQDKSGNFYFKTALSDQAVREIAAIEGLRGLWIWYGSFSDAQKAVVRERHPDCEFHENLNKM